MTEMFCQSCGMPLRGRSEISTDRDGRLNDEYCIYCRKEGEFTSDVTMDEMIEISLKHMRELFSGEADFNEAEALANMKNFFPQLKRWSA